MQDNIGQKANDTHKTERNHTHTDIIVLDVTHLVRKYRFELGVVHNIHKTSGCRHNSMARVATCRKRVRRWIINNIHFRRWHTGCNSKVLNHAI
ncbi:hypothetical protein D3C79_959170 [compost metagenome]